MANYPKTHEDIDKILSDAYFALDAEFEEQLRLQLRDRLTASNGARPLSAGLCRWLFSYPGRQALQEEDDMAKGSRLLTAFSTGVLVLALVAFFGIILLHSVCPELLSGAAPIPPGTAIETKLDEAQMANILATIVALTPNEWTHTDLAITAYNIDQIVELAQPQTDLGFATDIAFHPRMHKAFISGPEGTLIWFTDPFQKLGLMSFADRQGKGLILTPDGNWFLSIGGQNAQDTCLFRAQDSYGMKCFRTRMDVVHDGAFNATGTRLVSGGRDRSLRIWNVLTTEQLLVVKLDQSVISVAYSPDDSLVAAGLSSGEIRLFDPTTGKEMAVLLGHTGQVHTLIFSPTASLLASASQDLSIRLWGIRSDTEPARLEGHMQRITDLAFSSDGSVLASSGQDGFLRLWDSASGDMLRQIEPAPQVSTSDRWINGVDFSPDGSLLAFATGDGNGHIWGLPRE